jgi:starvation-inducible DNA-binding protein
MKNIDKKPAAHANSQIVALLNQSLAELLSLKLNAKQAHWNIKGHNFIALHELFDRVATEVDGFADTVAERAVQLGSLAEGGVAHISKRASSASYPQTTDAVKHVKALASQLEMVANQLRDAIDTSAELGDAVTADSFTQITSGLDKLRWFVSAHQ